MTAVHRSSLKRIRTAAATVFCIGTLGVTRAAPAPSDNGQLVSPLRMADNLVQQTLDLPSVPAFLAQALPSVRTRVTDFRERSKISVGKGYLQQLDLFPGERQLLVSSNEEARVRIYRRDTNHLLGNFAMPGAVRFASYAVRAWPELTPDATPLYVTASDHGLMLFSALNGAHVSTLDSRPATDLRWSPDGKVLVAAASATPSQASTLYFYQRNALTLTILGAITFDERVDAWDLSRDNRLLALSQYPSGAFRVLDLHSGRDLLRIPGPQFAGDVAIAPDGRSVAVGGAGLLVVDLLNPDRRAFYSHVFNNIGCVRFSPSGDLIAASAYDGRVRLFEVVDAPSSNATDVAKPRGMQLQLRKELHHAGQANVYEVIFEADGQGLLSASGDRTVRWFRAASTASATASSNYPTKYFRTLEQWRRDEPLAAMPWPVPPPLVLVDGHYHPQALREPTRPANLTPGRYACKITSMYRLRECLVSRDASGHTLLEFLPGNLLGLKGIVYNDGPALRFEGWLTEPSTLIDCDGCAKQPIHGVLRGSGKHFDGALVFRNYYDPNVPPALPALDMKREEALDSYPMELRPLAH